MTLYIFNGGCSWYGSQNIAVVTDKGLEEAKKIGLAAIPFGDHHSYRLSIEANKRQYPQHANQFTNDEIELKLLEQVECGPDAVAIMNDYE